MEFRADKTGASRSSEAISIPYFTDILNTCPLYKILYNFKPSTNISIKFSTIYAKRKALGCLYDQFEVRWFRNIVVLFFLLARAHFLHQANTTSGYHYYLVLRNLCGELDFGSLDEAVYRRKSHKSKSIKLLIEELKVYICLRCNKPLLIYYLRHLCRVLNYIRLKCKAFLKLPE